MIVVDANYLAELAELRSERQNLIAANDHFRREVKRLQKQIAGLAPYADCAEHRCGIPDEPPATDRRARAGRSPSAP